MEGDIKIDPKEVRSGLNSHWLRIGSNRGLFEHGTERSGSTKDKEFLDASFEVLTAVMTEVEVF
jgi:hypothetical protein